MVEVSLPRNPRPVKKDPVIENSINSFAGLSGGVSLSNDTPLALGNPAAPGSGTTASRWDHVHPLDGVSTGLWMFGSGCDGVLTLVANTTMTVDLCIRQYSSIDLAGFTLTGHASNGYMLLMCSGTLTLGGGTIQGAFTTSAAPGGTAPPNSSGGAGGDGGRTRFPVYVFARTISGTGTITAAGENGATGSGCGGNTDGNNHAGGNGQNGQTAVARWSSTTVNSLTCTGGQAMPTGFAGGAAAGSALTDKIRSQIRDIHRMVFWSDTVFTSSDSRSYFGTDGAGGGGGGASATGGGGFSSGDARDGGGGGGGGHGLNGAGGNGGNGANATGNDNNNKGSGAGGGGGGGGGLVLVMTDSAPSTLTITASGGNGGNGGNGTTGGGGGGGGGAGAGGIAFLIAQSGCTSTVTAVAGAAGAGGTGTNTDASPANGSPGSSATAGISATIVR